MSLLLRKLCQPVLDDYGLGHLHATEIDYNKTFRLTTECGKTTVVVSGIKFTKPNPNIPEITYAAELLEEFLAKNKLKVDAYLTAKKNFNSAPIIKEPENMIFNHTYLISGVKRTVTHTVNDLVIQITISKDDKHKIHIEKSELCNDTDVANFKINKKTIKSMYAALQNDSIKADLKHKAEEALAEFSACTV